MNMRSLCWIAAAAAIFAGLATDLPAAKTEAVEKPNIIFIMADDLGYGDLGSFGQERVQTPHLDRLAAEGMKLTDFYAGCTVCRPARLSLWTGLHMGHTPINSNAGYVFNPEDVTVMEQLKQAGYATGGVGKWAMGGPGSGGEPNRHGFDFWLGYLDQSEAHNYYPTHLWCCEGEEVKEFPLEGNKLMGDSGAERLVALPEHRETYSHDVMTEGALQFIKRHQENPFLLHVHWTIPHANNQGGRLTGDGMEVPDYGLYADKDWPDTEKGFAAMVTRMDRDVGRIVDLLRELEIEQKTLVFFTSDNGPHNEGGHDYQFFNSNGPLRGFKRDLYEGGIRVPTIAWWPGMIEPGSVSAEPLAFWDFMPTACELAGAETPQGIDGISFAPLLTGNPEDQPHHEHLFWAFGQERALRMGKWKAVQNDPDEPIELYDLSNDLAERGNVAATHPDLVEEMESIMDSSAGR